MAEDNTVAPAPTPAPITETVSAPVTSVVEPTSTVTPTPVVEVTQETPKVETVLGDALKEAPKEEVKTEEAKSEVKPEETKTEVKSEETKPEVKEEAKTEDKTEEVKEPVKPSYDPFTVPEGLQVDPERMSKFTDILANLESEGKVPHELVQKFGQEAVNFHISEVQRISEDVQKLYQTTWEQQKNKWKEDFLADPEIGGNRFQTTLNSALQFIRTHGGTPEQQAEFREVMNTSGLGNHPAIIRLLANAGRAMSEGRPLSAAMAAPVPKSRTETMYGSKKNYTS